MEAQWSLVLFTVISGAGAWLFATSMMGALAKKSPLPTKVETIVAIVLLAVGGVASVTHLKHIDRIFEALNHPTSGIFVEAALIGVLIVLALIYLIMVAQFQSLLSPFIIIFTVPLAFTGGFLGLLFAGEQLSMISLLGFLVLMGTVVNNGIVFVDYANQLRIGGMKKREALIMTGRTRMRPILMTALTTILAMVPMAISQSAGDSMGKGMAIVIIGGMAYATLMTLFIIPVMYDILYRRQPKVVDVGDDTIDDVPDDAAEFLAQLEAEKKD